MSDKIKKPQINWSINLGEILTFTSMVVVVAVFVVNLQEQISINRNDIEQFEARMDRQDDRFEEAMRRIESHLLEIREELRGR